MNASLSVLRAMLLAGAGLWCTVAVAEEHDLASPTDWSGLGSARTIRTFESLNPEAARTHAPPLLETTAGIRLQSRRGPVHGSALQFVYEVDAALLAVAGTAAERDGSSAEGGSRTEVRPELAPGPQLFAGMKAGNGFELFVGRRDTLRFGDRGALGGRGFRPGIHAVFDAGFFRLLASPYFREETRDSVRRELAPEGSRPPGPLKSDALPPGQLVAALAGTSDFVFGLFYELYRNRAGFSAEYGGLGGSFYRGRAGREWMGSASVEHVSNRGNSHSAPDGSARLGGTAARLALQMGRDGLVFGLRGFVAEPALQRRGSAAQEHERSGYVSPGVPDEAQPPVFSEGLGGVPAPTLCSRCEEGYAVSNDPSLFRAQAMTGAVFVGYSWRTGHVTFAFASIVPLRPRDHAGGGPFDDLRPLPLRLNEYGLRVRHTLQGHGELVAGYSRLETRTAGKSRAAAEMLWISFRKSLEAR